MPQQIQVRRGTAAQWASTNPVLANGEQGLETDTRKVKFGDDQRCGMRSPIL
jgi:Major tropism determinant N-terminal domain